MGEGLNNRKLEHGYESEEPRVGIEELDFSLLYIS